MCDDLFCLFVFLGFFLALLAMCAFLYSKHFYEQCKVTMENDWEIPLEVLITNLYHLNSLMNKLLI